MFDIKGCELAAKRVTNEIVWALEDVTEYVSDTTIEHKNLKVDIPVRRVTIEEYNNAIKAVKEYKYSDYDVFLVFTKNGYVKKLKSGTNIIGKLGETDEPIAILDTDNRSQIVLFDKRGSVHTMDVGAINQDDATTIGTPLSSYINIAGAPVSMFKRDDITDNTSFVFITKNGIKAPEKVLGTYVEVSGLGRCKIKDFNSRSPKYAFSVETSSGKIYRTTVWSLKF
jgi:DNA gyrase/topoisomerase IV subunit A